MDSSKLFAEIQLAMVNGTPLARYSKAVLGRLNVKIIDPVQGVPSDIILSGDGTKGEDTATLTFWTPVELAYFESANKTILAQGAIVPYTVKETVVVNPNVVTDEQITTVLQSKFFAVKKMLDGFTTPTPARRMLAIAESMNKPVGTINAIKTRLAELQSGEYEDVK